MLSAIWYHLHLLKNVKNTNGGVLLLAKSNTPPWVFSRFLNCKNGTKSRNASHVCGNIFVPWKFKYQVQTMSDATQRHM